MLISDIIKNINTGVLPKVEEVVALLKAQGEEPRFIYQAADELRARVMGPEIFLRGIIEFSNYCARDCFYCGIRANNAEVNRYRISDDEILGICKDIFNAGQTTVVLQSGEDPYYTKEKLGALVKKIKNETPLAVTLSVGERSEDTYAFWKKCGMDRYLLRFETSDERLYKQCHPDGSLSPRIECLHILKKLGVQTGSGFLIGLPGQSYEQLAKDILFCTGLELDMIGIGPFIPHKDTPFGSKENPFDKEVYFKTISIVRLLNPYAHIPSTTAFDAIDPNGRNLLLERGCNVFMPNATPQKYRKDYLLYPGKPCADESSADCAGCAALRVLGLGRVIGKGPGHSIRNKR